MKKKHQRSNARLDAFTRGVIWGMHVAGMKRDQMLDHVRKKDGTKLNLHNLDLVISRKKTNPDWKGEDSSAGGRPRELTDKEGKRLVSLVFKFRGKAKVTIGFCKKILPFLRRVDDTTVGEALHRAGLKWLRRRCKSWVPDEHKQARMAYAEGLKRKHQATLDRYAYTDGTTFYLCRGPADENAKRRIALGRLVWRMSSGKDGLHNDNVGPSMYVKAQGLPVKVWGFFARGRLCYWVLPSDPEDGRKTTHMNQQRYYDLICSRFVEWRHLCFGDDQRCHLVQDFEGCLRTPQNIKALRAVGCDLAEDHTKSSPDLNAIENMWGIVRQRLEDTEPESFENRAQFLVRLRRCVAWLNDNNHEHQLYLCTNQKERAQDVLDLQGAKTKW